MSKFQVLKGPILPLPANVNSLRDLLEANFKTAINPRDLVVAVDAQNGTKLYLDQLQAQSLRVAKALGKLGATRIGICFTPSLELIVLLAGLVRRGGSYIPLDPSLPTDRLKFFVEHSGVDLIIYDDKLELTADTTGWTSYQDLVNLKVDDKADYRLNVSKEDTFCVMYTSGSTGQPKGVVIPHRAMINRLVWQWSEYKFEANEAVCFKTQIGFGDSFAEIWAPLLQNIRIVVANKSLLMTPDALVSALEKYKVTRITVVPSLLRVLLSHLKDIKSSSAENYFELIRSNLNLKYVIASGEALTYDLCQSFFEIFNDGKVSLGNFYGSTELMADATAVTFGSMDDVNKYSYQGRVSIGSLVSNMTVIVHHLDSNGIGELVFTGASVTSGYLKSSHDQGISDKFVKASELGFKDFDDDLCFRSGDRGKIVDGKFLVYFGRTDSQVKISGNRVDLSEIELILKNRFNCVNPVVLFYNDRVLAFLAEDEQDVNRLKRDHLLEFLPSYAIPEIVTVDLIPHLPVSGKINRHALRAIYDEILALRASNVIDWGDELIKFRVLVDVLKELKIYVPDSLKVLLCSNFFSVGGTSLNAIMAISLIKQKGYYIDVDAFLSAQDLGGIVDLMSLSCKANKTDQSLSGQTVNEKYTIVPSSKLQSSGIIKLIASSFACCDQQIKVMRPSLVCSKCIHKEMKQIVERFYPSSLKDDISFSVLNSATGQLIGSCHNLDDADQPGGLHKGKLVGKFLKLLNAAELNHVNKLKADGITKIIHGFVTAVDRELITNRGERVEVMLLMERELLRVAKDRGYQAVVTTNTSKLTYDLAEHVLGYSVVETIEPTAGLEDDLVHKGRLFGEGSPDMFGKVCVKIL